MATISHGSESRSGMPHAWEIVFKTPLSIAGIAAEAQIGEAPRHGLLQAVRTQRRSMTAEGSSKHRCLKVSKQSKCIATYSGDTAHWEQQNSSHNTRLSILMGGKGGRGKGKGREQLRYEVA
jgi:hypothetical protein